MAARDVVYRLLGIQGDQEPANIVVRGRTYRHIGANLYGNESPRPRVEYVYRGSGRPESIVTPEGRTAYYNPRTRTYVTSRPRNQPRSYQEYKPRSRARLDRLIEERQQTTGISRAQSLRDIREGRWRPFARDPGDRVAPGPPGQFDEQGRITTPGFMLRAMPVNSLRWYAGRNKKASLFQDYLRSMALTSSAYSHAYFEFNMEGFQAKVDNWDRDSLIRWLQISYEDYIAEAKAQTQAWLDAGSPKGQEPDFWWYH